MRPELLKERLFIDDARLRIDRCVLLSVAGTANADQDNERNRAKNENVRVPRDRSWRILLPSSFDIHVATLSR